MKVIQFKRQSGRVTIDASEYPAYLIEISDKLPPGARAFATADWHYDPRSKYCPHDAWIQDFRLSEHSEAAHKVDIFLRLLGAYQDGEIELIYHDVIQYEIKGALLPHRGHGDWLTDEVTLNSDGHVVHEVILESGTWIIVCHEITYQWIEFNMTESS